MPLLIESVVSAVPSPVMKQPDGGAVNVTGKLFRNIIKIAILHCFLHRLAKTFSDKDAILSQPRRE